MEGGLVLSPEDNSSMLIIVAPEDMEFLTVTAELLVLIQPIILRNGIQ